MESGEEFYHYPERSDGLGLGVFAQGQFAKIKTETFQSEEFSFFYFQLTFGYFSWLQGLTVRWSVDEVINFCIAFVSHPPLVTPQKSCCIQPLVSMRGHTASDTSCDLIVPLWQISPHSWSLNLIFTAIKLHFSCLKCLNTNIRAIKLVNFSPSASFLGKFLT